MRFRRHLHLEFWRSLPRAGSLTFLLAVAATFGSMGFLIDLSHITTPFSNALYGAIFCALIAVGWFVSMTRDLRLLPFVLALHVAGTFFLAGPSRRPPFAAFHGLSLDRRLTLDATGALVCILTGYGGS